MEIARNFEFRVPPVILSGVGCAEKVGAEAKRLAASKALIVSDEGLVKLGYVDRVKSSLEGSGLRVEIFNDVPREPEMGFVENGLKEFRDMGCDLVVAVGGGSPIDTAKGIAVLATNGGSMKDYEGINKVPGPRAKLIAVPTTGGTGSEVSRFTIVTDVERKRKMLIGGPYIIPDVAVCDPIFTLTAPPELTMGTGVDALTHAIEAYVSVRAQPTTDLLALEAIRLISRNLRQAWANGNDIEARANMMHGSTLAGMAFSNSSVALVHGMSRPIGANFHLPHGLSNAILLPHVMEYSYIGNPKKYAAIAITLGERVKPLSLIAAARRSVEAIKRLCQDVKVPSLTEAGCDEKEVVALAPKMAEDAIASSSPANNPRKPTKDDIISLYKKALPVTQ